MSDNINDKDKNNYDGEELESEEITPQENIDDENISSEEIILVENSVNTEPDANEYMEYSEENSDSSDIPEFLNHYESDKDDNEFDVPEISTDLTEETEDVSESTKDLEQTQKIAKITQIPIKKEKIYHKSFFDKIILKISDKISEIKNAEPKKRMQIVSLYFAVMLIIVLILTDIIPILPNAYNRFYVGNSFVIGETQGGIYDKLGKNILYAGNGSIMSFAPDMRCVFKEDTAVGTPKLETSGENAIVHYTNSKDAILITNGSELKKIDMPEEITGAAISRSGYHGFVTKEAGYKSCVNIFNPERKSVYKWHTNNPVIDISVSNSGKNMVAASYTYESNAMSGKLIFFDTTNSEPLKEVVAGSNVFSELKFINDDVVVAFGDMFTAAYTYKGVMKWRVDYDGRTLKSYDLTDNGEIAFIFDRYSSELSESTVEIYNSSGRLKGKYESKDNVKYVSANNGCFLLSLDRHTILLDGDADVMKKRKTQKDFRKAVLYHNYNFAFSVSDSVAEILSVNH